MNETTTANIRKHVDQLCRAERSPHSPGYYRAQEYIEDTIRSYGHKVMRHHFNDIAVGSCRNIYTETGPKEGKRILIGAHYDGLKKSGPAADDNASAVAIAMELLRLAPQDIPMTVVFFDVEENFGWGALHGSASFSDFYKKDLYWVLIMDLVGGWFAPGFEKHYFQFGDALPRICHPELDIMNMPMKFLEPLGKIISRSDYDIFRRRGIPYTFFSSGTPWYYHTQNDTPDILDYDKMTKLTEALLDAIRADHEIGKLSIINWDQFDAFMKKLLAVEELQTDFLKKLHQQGAPLSRLQLLRMYAQVLPLLRKHGKSIWPDKQSA